MWPRSVPNTLFLTVADLAGSDIYSQCVNFDQKHGRFPRKLRQFKRVIFKGRTREKTDTVEHLQSRCKHRREDSSLLPRSAFDLSVL